MSTQSVQPTAVPMAAVIPNVAGPSEHELKQAYQRLIEANDAHRQRGLDFGKLCYQLREQHSNQGSRKNQGFEAVLNRLAIKKTTAYRWIKKYELKHGLRATRYEVNGKQQKQTKPRPPAITRHVALDGDLPAGYEREKWDEDVKMLGGSKKIWPMFVQFVQQQAEAKRRMQTGSKKVH